MPRSSHPDGTVIALKQGGCVPSRAGGSFFMHCQSAWWPISRFQMGAALNKLHQIGAGGVSAHSNTTFIRNSLCQINSRTTWVFCPTTVDSLTAPSRNARRTVGPTAQVWPFIWRSTLSTSRLGRVWARPLVRCPHNQMSSITAGVSTATVWGPGAAWIYFANWTCPSRRLSTQRSTTIAPNWFKPASPRARSWLATATAMPSDRVVGKRTTSDRCCRCVLT